MLQDNLSAGRLQFTTDYDVAADFADVHFLGVGTPQKKGEYGADLRHVNAVIDELVPRLTRPSVIVGKSTVPVGTAAALSRRAKRWRPMALTSKSPGIPSSCARVSGGCRTPCTPIASSLAYNPIRNAPRQCCGRCTHPCSPKVCRSC